MEPYIKKSALIAEMKRLKESFVNERDDFEKGYHHGLDMILVFLDTLETKEVDLEKELDKYTADNFWALEGNNESPYLLEKDDMLKVARYFFELGLKAKGE